MAQPFQRLSTTYAARAAFVLDSSGGMVKDQL